MAIATRRTGKVSGTVSQDGRSFSETWYSTFDAETLTNNPAADTALPQLGDTHPVLTALTVQSVRPSAGIDPSSNSKVEVVYGTTTRELGELFIPAAEVLKWSWDLSFIEQIDQVPEAVTQIRVNKDVDGNETRVTYWEPSPRDLVSQAAIITATKTVKTTQANSNFVTALGQGLTSAQQAGKIHSISGVPVLYRPQEIRQVATADGETGEAWLVEHSWTLDLGSEYVAVDGTGSWEATATNAAGYFDSTEKVGLAGPYLLAPTGYVPTTKATTRYVRPPFCEVKLQLPGEGEKFNSVDDITQAGLGTPLFLARPKYPIDANGHLSLFGIA